MPGPLPKNPSIRQRRNKKVTRADLPAELMPIESMPALPENPLGDWHDMTEQWWDDVWTSPQHHEFLRADLGALFRLAMLMDVFWKSGKLSYAKEIRLLEREFGLTPMARRRLEWSVVNAEDAKDKHERRRSKQATIVNGSDPRTILQ